MQRTAIIRICVLAFLAMLAWWGWLKVRGDDAMTFVYVIAVGAAAGFLVVKYVVPWFGDAVGTALFSSGEMVGEDASMKAAAKLAQGDYEGAIAEHEKSLAENPAQVFPVGEIAKICADKLNDPARALRVLQERLAGHDRSGRRMTLPFCASAWWTFISKSSATTQPRRHCWRASSRIIRTAATAPTPTTASMKWSRWR